MPLAFVRQCQGRMTDRAAKVLDLAEQTAKMMGHRFITPEHVLYALTQTTIGAGATALQRLGVDITKEADALRGLAMASSESSTGGEPTPSPQLIHFSLHFRLKPGL